MWFTDYEEWVMVEHLATELLHVSKILHKQTLDEVESRLMLM